ncbi:DegT/DnrJ/EryC1/StrS family aminotransferase [Solirubrobacter sp. CPCC 204708]|uniref:DegT/DnrJ/EryC1/StrS family aminotransferase n=1 Tax=Solirubrobacter deserti TaxID=2282478 RepID=A0ABT4RIH2_9ACTN|nr:DegT/DnrJ/EryC1/StrS family aminotransferase [Solirubrobacter deserti]MBE2320255.1 DegT/DnrJ/EryC1/StrS family aminotransferase [Solirubrobacter deserti]MDA0138359.1 DegT/DnrJ/EryC1/StrS family aminotransferase [Solirubrobacter deserti]
MTSTHTEIPLTRLDNADPALTEELLAVVGDLASRSAFIGGPEVDAFDREFADYCGTAHAVGLSSGTEALALALRALGVGPGDEVIVPANSFIATAEAVTLVGAQPRFVDVDPDTALMTAAHLAAAIGPNTRCVMPVHLYGRTLDLDPIVEVARAAGLFVVEDACQAHGAFLGERRAGSIGHAAAFSFYPAKNLGAWGDAGAMVTNDEQIADTVRLLRSHGERPRYHHRMPGTTARLDAIQAAVLRVKLPRLEAANAGRRRAAAALTKALSGGPVRTPAPATDGGDHVFHQYVVTTPARDALREHLAAHGVASAIHYPVPIHLTQAYAAQGEGPGSLPVAERLAKQSCTLPMWPTMEDHVIERVAEVVHDFQALDEAA